MNNLTFTIDDLLEYFVAKNGSVIYTDIVTHFKSALSDPQTRDIARSVFKDHVNTLATVSTINGTKYLLLRDKFKKHLVEPSNEPSPVSCLPGSNSKQSKDDTQSKLLQTQQQLSHQQQQHPPSQNHPHHQQQQQQCMPIVQASPTSYTQNPTTPVMSNSANHVHSKLIKLTNEPNNHHQPSQINDHRSNTIPDEELMPPPPRPLRHKSSNANEQKRKIQMSQQNNPSANQQQVQHQQPVHQQPQTQQNPQPKSNETLNNPNHHQQPNNTNHNNKENVTPEPPNENEVKKEIQELAMTAGRVKEHAQILNKLTSNGDFKLPMPSAVTSVVNKIRSGQPPGNDSDSGHFSITEKHKKWIVAAATCDYKEMNNMLKEDTSLASYCDFMNGYNALHWAAKFGRPDIVKLIAGKYQVDPNLKSFSGSTPLHLAASFGHSVIWELLVDVYGANKDIRDNTGKKPSSYLKKSESNKIEAKKETEDPSSSPSPKEDHSEKHEPKMNLRNKITYQSMLVRNKFRKSKSFQRRKSVAKS